MKNGVISVDDGNFSINGNSNVIFPGYYNIYFAYEETIATLRKSYTSIKEDLVCSAFLNKSNSLEEAVHIANSSLSYEHRQYRSYVHKRLYNNSIFIEFDTHETMNKIINHNNDDLSFDDIFENFLEIGLEYLDYCILKVKSVDTGEFFTDNEIRTLLLHGLAYQLSTRLQSMKNVFEIENILMSNVGVDNQTIKNGINDLTKSILDFLIKSRKMNNKVTGNDNNQYGINPYLESNDYMIKDMIEVLAKEVDSYRELVLASSDLDKTIEEEKRLREHHELYKDVLIYHKSLIESYERSSQLDMITSQIHGMNEIMQLNRKNIISIGQSFSHVTIINHENTIDEPKQEKIPITKKIAISLKRVWTG